MRHLPNLAAEFILHNPVRIVIFGQYKTWRGSEASIGEKEEGQCYLLSKHIAVSCNQIGTVFAVMSSWIALTWHENNIFDKMYGRIFILVILSFYSIRKYILK